MKILLSILLFSSALLSQSGFIKMCLNPSLSQAHTFKRLHYGSFINTEMDFAYEENLCSFMDTKLLGIHSIVNSMQNISDTSPYAFFKNLEYLNLSFNKIKDLKPLNILKNIKKLDLRNNPISNINVLSKFKNLVFLDLRGTKVNDLSSLIHNKKLNELLIRDLKLKKCSAKNLKELKQGITCIKKTKYFKFNTFSK